MPKSRAIWKLVREHCDFDPVQLIQERGKQIILGRAKADVVCASAYASRHHCTITFKNDKFYVRDLNSTNGTFWNGTKILKQTDRELRHNDRIGLGVGDSSESECSSDCFIFRVLKFEDVRGSSNTEALPDEEEEEGAINLDSDGTTDIDEVVLDNLGDNKVHHTSTVRQYSNSPERGARIAPPPPKISTTERNDLTSTTGNTSSSSKSSSYQKNIPLISSNTSIVHSSVMPSTSRAIHGEHAKEKMQNDRSDRRSQSSFAPSPLEEIEDISDDSKKELAAAEVEEKRRLDEEAMNERRRQERMKWERCRNLEETNEVQLPNAYVCPGYDSSFDSSCLSHPISNVFALGRLPLPQMPGPPVRSITALRDKMNREQELARREAAANPEEDEDFAYVRRYVEKLEREIAKI